MIQSLSASNASQRVNIDKLLATVAFTFIVAALFVIATTPLATGYEISIYAAYPPYFWFFIIVAIACGIVILVHQAFAEKPSRWWIAGFSAILFTNLIILLLPIARGYVTLGRGDVLSHIGMTKDILLTGHFPLAREAAANPYPAIHILGANLSLVTGLTPELIAELFPGFFTLFYMVSIYLLSREVASYRGQVLLITAFGSLLLFKHANLMLAPSVQCYYLLPFTLFLLYRARASAQRSAFSFLLILVLLLIPFLHPGEGSIFFMVTFLCLDLSLWLYRTVKRSQSQTVVGASHTQTIGALNPSLILFVTWFAWFSYSYIFAGTIRSVWNWVVHEAGTTTAMEYADMLAKAGLSLSEFAHLFFNTWGHAAIYGLVAAVISTLVWKKFLSPRDTTEANQFTFSFLFIVFGILLFVAFFSEFIWVEYNREIIYVIFAATVLNGLGLYALFRNRHKKIGMIFTVLLLIATATIGIFNTFPSPMVREGNSQVTRMEMTGMDWFFTHQDNSLLIDENGVSQARFSGALYGVTRPSPNIRYSAPPPDHFNYSENDMYGQSYAQDTYFVESELSRIVYPEIFPEYEHLWRFTPADFQRLDNHDFSVSRIYSNGGFWVYYIEGMSTASP